VSQHGQKPHEHLTARYQSSELKADYLNQLFNTSAHQYDRILKYGFFGTGGAYRRRALQKAGLHSEMIMVDMACGTGGVLEQAMTILPSQNIIGIDPSTGMLASARLKFPQVCFLEGRAEAIPMKDQSADFIVMGYALRHVTTLEECFRDFYRVLRPGGKVLILELSRPSHKWGYIFFRWYLKYVLPALGWVITRNRDAPKMMRYFWDSIEVCVERSVILKSLEDCGFLSCKNDSELGVFSAFSGTKPV